MKIRIKGNSLRYRLTKSEVDRLWCHGSLEESTEFAGRTLRYAVEQTIEPGTALSADFTGDKIVLHIPKEMIGELAETERIGFEGCSGAVSLLIEKDFVCIDRTGEDQSDNYPNPSVTCK